MAWRSALSATESERAGSDCYNPFVAANLHAQSFRRIQRDRFAHSGRFCCACKRAVEAALPSLPSRLQQLKILPLSNINVWDGMGSDGLVQIPSTLHIALVQTWGIPANDGSIRPSRITNPADDHLVPTIAAHDSRPGSTHR
jgi:hypothetical protein